MPTQLVLLANAAVLVFAVVASGCAKSPSDRPTWGLTGQPGERTGAIEPPRPVAEPAKPTYRGGRDPVTGKADVTLGPTEPVSAVMGKSTRARPDGSVIVQDGETLFRIAQRERVSVAALMAENNLKTLTIVPGQSLEIPR